MALHWDVSAIVAREGEDFVWPMEREGDEESRRLNGAIECVIWATIFVGMSRITEANWATFAARTRAWERGVGHLSGSGEPLPADLFRRCVGLTTNASPKSLTAFEKDLGKAVLREAKRLLEAEVDVLSRKWASGQATGDAK